MGDDGQPCGRAEQLGKLLQTHLSDSLGELGVGRVLLLDMLRTAGQAADLGVGAHVNEGNLLEVTPFEPAEGFDDGVQGRGCHHVATSVANGCPSVRRSPSWQQASRRHERTSAIRSLLTWSIQHRTAPPYGVGDLRRVDWGRAQMLPLPLDGPPRRTSTPATGEEGAHVAAATANSRPRPRTKPPVWISLSVNSRAVLISGSRSASAM